MDGTRLQQLAWKGYAKAAEKVGFIYSQYRPTTGIDPISAPYLVTTTFYASFNVDWNYMKANKYGNSVFQTIADGRILQVADYLASSTRTFFIISMDECNPIQSIECNAIGTFFRPKQSIVKGKVGYVGFDVSDSNFSQVIMQNIPLSILAKTGRGRENPTKLPMDTSWPRWDVLVPYLGGVTLRVGDVLSINNDEYLIDSNELTNFGWRLSMKRVVV